MPQAEETGRHELSIVATADEVRSDDVNSMVEVIYGRLTGLGFEVTIQHGRTSLTKDQVEAKRPGSGSIPTPGQGSGGSYL